MNRNNKSKKIRNKLYRQVDEAKKKIDNSISIKDVIKDMKNEPKDKIFGDEFHANLITKKKWNDRAEFCGPGTFVETRLLRGDKGKTSTDKICRQHDLDYRLASNTKGLSKKERVKITQDADKKMLKSLENNSDYLLNKLKMKFAINLKKVSENIGAISKDKYIGKSVKANDRDEYEYTNALVNFVNEIDDTKVLMKLIKKPTKQMRKFILDVSNKKITLEELNKLLD
jgi:hypothetical protein